MMNDNHSGVIHCLKSEIFTLQYPTMMQAMELLRTLVQPLIDADVSAVMRKYVDAYFRPAVNNAIKNLGRDSID